MKQLLILLNSRRVLTINYICNEYFRNIIVPKNYTKLNCSFHMDLSIFMHQVPKQLPI